MSTLLRKPTGKAGKIHDITIQNARGPLSADWRFVGFGLYRLQAGDSVGEATNDLEAILVMVEGKAAVTIGGQAFGEIGERMDVFEQIPPHAIYAPKGTKWRADATTDCTIAVCTAPGKGGHPARILPVPERMIRGKGANTRYI